MTSKHYRSLGYMRPLAIWSMQWALEKFHGNLFDGASRSEVAEDASSCFTAPNGFVKVDDPGISLGKDENVDSNEAGDSARVAEMPKDNNVADELAMHNDNKAETDNSGQNMVQDIDIVDSSDVQIKDTNSSVEDSSITDSGLADSTNNENASGNQAEEKTDNSDSLAEVVSESLSIDKESSLNKDST